MHPLWGADGRPIRVMLAMLLFMLLAAGSQVPPSVATANDIPVPAQQPTVGTEAHEQAPTFGAAATLPNNPVVSGGAVTATAAGGSTGSASTTIAITVPPFHGLQPRLLLQYGSDMGNGWLGVGWALSGLSTIDRVSAGHGVPQFRDDDLFRLDNRDLTPCSDIAPEAQDSACRYQPAYAGAPGCISSSYAHFAYYTTRDETGQLICRGWSRDDSVSQVWTVTSRDGTVSTLRPLYTGPHGAEHFVVISTSDLSGNQVRFKWDPFDPAAKELPELDTIEYNDVRIKFYSEHRTDTVTAFNAGETIFLTRRLKTILISVASGTPPVYATARAYGLSYSQSPNNGRSTLQSVQEYGNNVSVDNTGAISGASPDTITPAQTFTTDTTSTAAPLSLPSGGEVGDEYPPAPPPLRPPPPSGFKPPTGLTIGTSAHYYNGQYRTGDLLGTGRTGAVLLQDLGSCRLSVYAVPVVGSAAVQTGLNNPKVDGRQVCLGTSQWWLTDMNGDGPADLAFVTVGPTGSDGQASQVIVTYLNRGDGSFDPVPVATLSVRVKPSAQITCSTGDVEGNHHAAVVCTVPAAGSTTAVCNEELVTYELGRAVQIGPGFQVPYNDKFYSGEPCGKGDYAGKSELALGDVNGDGRTDAMITIEPFKTIDIEPSNPVFGFNVATSLLTMLSIGNGKFEARPPKDLGGYVGFNTWLNPELMVTDLNGDGLADLAVISGAYTDVGSGEKYYSTGWISTAISLGNGDWKFHDDPVPQIWQQRVGGGNAIPTSFDGDTRNGLMFITGRDGSTTAPTCSPRSSAIPYGHVEELRVSSNGDGSFTWPTSLDDCARTQEIDVNIEDNFFADLGAFFAGVVDVIGSGFTRGLPYAGHGAAVMDADGDGQSDIMFVNRPAGQDTPDLIVDYTPPPQSPVAGWQPVDLPGDGRNAFIRIDTTNAAAPRLDILQPRQGPTFGNCLKRFSPFCTPYTIAHETLTVPQAAPMPIQGNWRAVDLTGNGNPDLVYIDSSVTHVFPDAAAPQPATMVATYPARTQGVGWDETPIVGWFKRDAPAVMGPWQIGDVAGDGRLGLLSVELTSDTIVVHALTLDTFQPKPPPGTNCFKHPEAYGCHPITAWTEHPSQPLPRPPGAASGWRVVDVNGDRRSDLLEITSSGAPLTLINNGVDAPWSMQLAPASIDDSNQSSWLTGDFTGRGVTDLIHLQQDTTAVHILLLSSTGGGSWAPEPIKDAEITQSDLPHGRWTDFDTNGDGIPNLVLLASGITQPSGKDTAIVLRSTGYDTFTPDDPVALNVSQSVKSHIWLPLDPDGGGVTALATIGATTSGGYDISLSSTPNLADRLTRVSNGIGGSAVLTYEPSRGRRIGTQGQGCGVPSSVGFMSVASLVTDDGNGNSTVLTNDYACPQWSREEHRPLGWQITATDTAASASRPESVTRTTHLLSPLCGDQGRTQTITSGGSVLRSEEATYPSVPPGNPGSCQASTTKTRFCAATDNCATEFDSYTYDPYGNIREHEQDAPGGQTRPPLNRVITTTYQDPGPTNLVSLARSVTLTTKLGSETKAVSERTFCYDNNCQDNDCQGPVARPRGLLTEVNDLDLSDPEKNRHSCYKYDDVGNLIETDAAGARTVTSYDPDAHIYPATVTDALDHKTTQTWDVTRGVQVATTDQNYLTTIYKYDPYGRVLDITYPSGQKTHTRYLDFGQPPLQKVRTYTDDGSPDGIWTDTQFDGLGRATVVSRKGDTPDRTEATRSSYADAGSDVYIQTHWSTESSLSVAPAETYYYDGLGRLVRQHHSDGTSTANAYEATPSGLSVVETDETGRTRTLEYDAWGRQAGINQPDPGQAPGNTSLLTFGYDAADNVVSIADPAGNTVTRTWNSLGELTSEHDADRGTSTYTYDLAGNLATFTDARGKTIRFYYDLIHRLVRRTDPDARTATVWHYDEPHHGKSIGQLTSVQDPSADGCRGQRSENYTYDLAGRLSTTTACTAGRSASFTAEYDAYGRQRAVIYPDRETVPMSYGPSGRPSALGAYTAHAVYDPSGQLARLTLGNGVTESWSYDPVRGWLNAINAMGRRSSVFNSTIGHNPDGTVASLSSTAGGDNRTLNYDALHRLTSATGDVSSTANFDTTGNITSRSSLGSYSYGQHNCAGQASSAPPHGVSQIGPAGNPSSERFCYDADGNRTRMQGPGIRQDITWTANGTPARIITTRSTTNRARTYTVVNGDSLWGIAQKFYRNGYSWPAIYNANRRIIVCPNLIYVGQRFVIPADPRRPGRDASHSRTVSDTQLTYGAEGQLVRQRLAGQLEILYFGPSARWESSRGLVKNYYFGGILIASGGRSGTAYYQTDHLGSPQAITNSKGNVTARVKYDPWGNAAVTYGHIPAGTPGFAGATPILGTQFLQMGARLYDPALGNFASADTVSPSTGDVQGANRYAYAANDPASSVDPSGHEDLDPMDEWGDPGMGAYGEGLGQDPQHGYEDQPWEVGSAYWTDPGYIEYQNLVSSDWQAPTGLPGDFTTTIDTGTSGMANSPPITQGASVGNSSSSFTAALQSAGSWVAKYYGINCNPCGLIGYGLDKGWLTQTDLEFLALAPLLMHMEMPGLSAPPESANLVQETGNIAEMTAGINGYYEGGERAFNSRTVGALLSQTPEGNNVITVAAGATPGGLTPEQRTFVQDVGAIPLANPLGIHAEGVLLEHAYDNGWTPIYLYTQWEACAGCSVTATMPPFNGQLLPSRREWVFP